MSDDIEDLLLGDEEPEPEKPKSDNQLAAAQRRLNKAEKELEELRAFKAETEKQTRTAAVGQAFSTLGLNPKQASFYQGEDHSVDAIKAWALEVELLQPQEDEE